MAIPLASDVSWWKKTIENQLESKKILDIANSTLTELDALYTENVLMSLHAKVDPVLFFDYVTKFCPR
jgi:hypothetical protein